MIVPIDEMMRARARRVGALRQQFHDERGTRHRYGATTPGDRMHVEGALGEIVVAKVFGVLEQWVEVADDYKGLPGDIAPGVQVRATTHARGRLLTHRGDRDDHIFVFVRLLEQHGDIVGFILGYDTKRAEYWQELQPGRGCYVVPCSALTRLRIKVAA